MSNELKAKVPAGIKESLQHKCRDFLYDFTDGAAKGTRRNPHYETLMVSQDDRQALSSAAGPPGSLNSGLY